MTSPMTQPIPPPPPSRRPLPGLVPLVLLGVIILWFYPWLMPGQISRDADLFYLFNPAWKFAHGELMNGHVPLWNPSKYQGAPFLANLMVPVFYPPQALALVLPLWLPVPFVVQATLAAHFLLAGCGMAWAARRVMGVARGAALLAGLTVMLCAPWLAHRSHLNQVFAMAWLPWLISLTWTPTPVGWARWLQRMVALACVVGMLLLAGQPQIAFYGALLMAAGLALECLRRPRRVLIATALPVCAGLLGLLLAAVHWLPARELLTFSFRRMIADSFANSFYLPWRNLITLLLPSFFGAPATGGYTGEWNYTETATFIGQPALLLGMLGLVTVWLDRSRRRIVQIALLVMALGLGLALGPQTPLLGWLGKVLPGLLDFRSPARAFVLVVLVLALFAAAGMQVLLDRCPPAMRRRCCVVLLLAQLLCLGWLRFGLDAWRTMDAEVFRQQLTQSLPYPAAGEYGRMFQLVDEVDYTSEALPEMERGIWLLQSDLNVLAGLAAIDGYDEGMLPCQDHVRVMNHYWRNFYHADPDPWLLGLMNVRWLIADKPLYTTRWRPLAEGQPPGGGRPARILLNPQWRGPVFTRADWPEIDFERLELPAFVERATEPRNLLRTGIDPDAELWHKPPPPTLSFTRLGAGRYHVELKPDAPREVLLSANWFPGWWAVLPDGRRIAGQNLQGLAIRFELPAEATECELIYRPRSYERGLLLTELGWAVLGMLLLGSRIGLRRQKASAPATVAA